MVLQVLATGVEKSEFVSGGLTLKDLLDEMSAPRGIAITDEKDGFGNRILIAKGQEKGKCREEDE